MFKQGKLDYIRIAIVITGVFIYSCEKEVSSDKLVERNGLTYELNSETPFSGKSVEFFEGGEVKRESRSYKDGLMHGVSIEWYENGQKKIEQIFEKGQKNGAMRLWHDNGQLWAETSWENGKINGIFKDWRKDGQPDTEQSYKDDELHGTQRTWHENGQLGTESTFVNGEIEGLFNKWYENGILAETGNFKSGQKEGTWKYWDREGEITKEQIYINGLLESTRLLQSVTDIDGNIYEIIKIGNQVWMAENLKVTHYRNGDPIPNLKSGWNWKRTKKGAFCYYDNSDKNGKIFGALYNWYAVEDSRNIAPDGWHIPTDGEWNQLEIHLGMSQAEADEVQFRGTNEGSKLAGNASLWLFDGALKDETEFGTSGFTALPGGSRLYESGDFGGMGEISTFWTSTYFDHVWESAHYRLIFYADTRSRGEANQMGMGLSVRCVKD